MQPDTARSILWVKMNGYRFDNLVLQIPKVFALRRNAPRTIRCIPGSHKPSGILIPLNLECDFVHRYEDNVSREASQWRFQARYPPACMGRWEVGDAAC